MPSACHISTRAHDAVAPILDSFVNDKYQEGSQVKFIYTTNPSWPYPKSELNRKRCRIVVTDSSFNPPHIGHIALCRAGLQSNKAPELNNVTHARLLLFSITNADKGTPDIESVSHRIEMMRLLAPILDRTDNEHDGTDGGTSVCVVREPIIVDKCSLLRKELIGTRLVERAQDLALVVVCGWDTLVRFLNPKYYDDMDASMRRFFVDEQCELVCARRGGLSESEEQRFWDDNPSAKPWRHYVTMVDLDARVADVSSTAIRDKFRQGTKERVEEVLEAIEEYVRKNRLY